MMPKTITSDFGRFFEDFEIGSTYKHALRKTVTESDNNLFCLLTMNHNPLHLDTEYAVSQQHGEIVVVGTLVFSLIVGITVIDISGKAIANLEYDQIKHTSPVYIGDTLHAETEVLEKRTSKTKNDRGIIYVITRAFNQRNECVITFRRRVLIPRHNV